MTDKNAVMQGRYDAALLQVNDPTSGLYDLWEFLTALIDYARGKVTSVPEISSDPKTFEEYIKKFYTAVVLMKQGEVDAVIKLGDQGNYLWKKRFFSRIWDRDKFHQQIMQVGLVDYWRESGKWGDMCRTNCESMR